MITFVKLKCLKAFIPRGFSHITKRFYMLKNGYNLVSFGAPFGTKCWGLESLVEHHTKRKANTTFLFVFNMRAYCRHLLILSSIISMCSSIRVSLTEPLILSAKEPIFKDNPERGAYFKKLLFM